MKPHLTKRRAELVTKLQRLRLQLVSRPFQPYVIGQEFAFEGYTDAEVIECGGRQQLDITKESGIFVIRLASQRTPMPHIMLDIETLALHPSNALILSIGMVEFDPTGESFVIGNRTIIRPDLAEQLLLGRVVESGTQKFWADQPREAQDDWRLGSRSTLAETAERIAAFTDGVQSLWANHTNFDISNVATLIRQAGRAEPWHYRAPTDMPSWLKDRTRRRFSDLHEDCTAVAHTAISDCIVQAHRVWQHWPEPTELDHHPV